MIPLQSVRARETLAVTVATDLVRRHSGEFTDQSHLTRHFRRINGMALGAWAATFPH